MRNSAVSCSTRRDRLTLRFGALSAAALAAFLAAKPAWPAEPAVKAIDLKLGAGVGSIATRTDGRGFVAATSNCKVIYLNLEARLETQYVVDGCKLMFTVHIGQVGGSEAATASIYTGHGVVLSKGQIAKYKTHDAAVTDAFLAFGGLLTGSDDGSVVLSPLGDAPASKVLAAGQGVAREVLPDPSSDQAHPTFFVGFDSGRVVAVAGSRTRTFEAGVGRINGLALSPDRKSLFVGGFDGRVRRIDVTSGTSQDVFSAGADVNAIALDDATLRLGIVSDTGRLVVIDTRTGQTVVDVKLSNRPLGSVALTAGAHRALVGDAGGILYRVDLPDTPQSSQ